jgi:hypothetical protein
MRAGSYRFQAVEQYLGEQPAVTDAAKDEAALGASRDLAGVVTSPVWNAF